MTIKLSTGRDWVPGGAGDDIIGISADLEVTVGYDHGNNEWEGDYGWECNFVPMSPAEKIEVCDLMIDRWRRLKDRIAARKDDPT